MHPNQQDPQTWMYPPIEPYHSGMLSASPVHSLYFEESGNPQGKPVIFMHGGPGGGTSGDDRRYFNPNLYRIILMDQRGSGKSKPMANLEENTTWHLIEDFEKLRMHLGIANWQVFGGSWGCTIALTYAITHPTRVTELVLRGVFLLRKKEIDWYYQHGASEIYPDAWESYLNHIPKEERGDLVKAYHKRLTSPDPATQASAAKTWTMWEMSTSRLYTTPEFIAAVEKDSDFLLKFARIECHYFINHGFFKEDNWLIDHIEKIRDIPAVIVQGRYDVVCPMVSAWDLHRAWPEAKLKVIPDAGHSSREPGIARALVSATDSFAALGR